MNWTTNIEGGFFFSLRGNAEATAERRGRRGCDESVGWQKLGNGLGQERRHGNLIAEIAAIEWNLPPYRAGNVPKIGLNGAEEIRERGGKRGKGEGESIIDVCLKR